MTRLGLANDTKGEWVRHQLASSTTIGNGLPSVKFMCIVNRFVRQIFKYYHAFNFNFFLYMCYAYMSLWYQSSVLRHRGIVQQHSIVMMFQTFTYFQNIGTSSIQQLIVELILGHLVLEEEEFINANNTPRETW